MQTSLNMMCCREMEAGQAHLTSLQELLQAEPSFQALQHVIHEANADVHAQLQWQELVDSGWEMVQRGDVVQQWLADGHATSSVRPARQQQAAVLGWALHQL